MALMGKKKADTCSTGCFIGKWALCLLLFIVTVAALAGVYETHVVLGDADRFPLQFGSTSGSLAIMAFVVASVSWMKHMICCMSPCQACSK